MKVCCLALGAYGDIISCAISIALHERLLGNEVYAISSEPFVNVWDGCSFVTPISVPFPYNELNRAIEWAEQQNRFDKILVCQVYGSTAERLTSSFVLEMWRVTGYYEKFNSLPLIFDNRNPEREKKWLPEPQWDKALNVKPLLLISYSGKSSPFPFQDDLIRLAQRLSDKYQVVDISNLKCERIYDLLGLYEEAAYLIATDSAPLHLANAVPQLKVIALATHSPDDWHGSPRKPNHVMHVRYRDFPNAVKNIERVLMDSASAAPARLLHVWSDYPNRPADAAHRHSVALQSWQREFANGLWRERAFYDEEFPRNGRTEFGDKKVPFVNDLFRMAAAEAGDSEIVVFTNDDTVLLPGCSETIISTVRQHGALYGWRYELHHIGRPPTMEEARTGYKHVGADVIAFSKRWWKEHGDKFPDFLISFEQWDMTIKKLIVMTGGVEVGELCAHEIHASYWLLNRDCPGGKFNRQQAWDWYKKHNIPWE